MCQPEGDAVTQKKNKQRYYMDHDGKGFVAERFTSGDEYREALDQHGNYLVRRQDLSDGGDYGHGR